MKQRKTTAARRRSPAREEKLQQWEQAAKSKVVSFAVEKLSRSLRVARWLPARYAKGRNAFPYQLPR